MLNRDKLAVDIGSDYIKIMFGNRSRVKLFGAVKTPENSFLDDNIIELNPIKDSIMQFIEMQNIKGSKISFSIHGRDMLVRHIEVPIMDKKSIRKAVEWEVGQYLPDNGSGYYMDYEILDTINNDEKKVYKLLVAAVQTGKIDRYVELSKALGFEIHSIDVSANCVTRVLGLYSGDDMKQKSIGVLDIGYRSTSVIILDHGKLFMEKEIDFSISNITDYINTALNLGKEQSEKYLFNSFDINNDYDSNDMHKHISFLFDDMISTFEKIIQFYTTGKVNKNLDEIIIMGGGSRIPGIDNYIKNELGCAAYSIDGKANLQLKIKVPEGCELIYYLNTLGLLLRKE